LKKAKDRSSNESGWDKESEVANATSLRVAAVVPARMVSSRFPGKPLAQFLRMSMIEHVYHRVAMCNNLDAAYVATCDDEIFQATVTRAPAWNTC
jgi:CMP-2-keto-3-deoxyoctulosonic acid synthetase